MRDFVLAVCYLEQNQDLLHFSEVRSMKAFDFSVPARFFFGTDELRRLQETSW